MTAPIGVARWLAPGDEAVFPAWQGMQYTRDNDRYADLSWTSVRDRFADNPA